MRISRLRLEENVFWKQPNKYFSLKIEVSNETWQHEKRFESIFRGRGKGKGSHKLGLNLRISQAIVIKQSVYAHGRRSLTSAFSCLMSDYSSILYFVSYLNRLPTFSWVDPRNWFSDTFPHYLWITNPMTTCITWTTDLTARPRSDMRYLRYKVELNSLVSIWCQHCS